MSIKKPDCGCGGGPTKSTSAPHQAARIAEAGPGNPLNLTSTGHTLPFAPGGVFQLPKHIIEETQAYEPIPTSSPELGILSNAVLAEAARLQVQGFKPSANSYEVDEIVPDASAMLMLLRFEAAVLDVVMNQATSESHPPDSSTGDAFFSTPNDAVESDYITRDPERLAHVHGPNLRAQLQSSSPAILRSSVQYRPYTPIVSGAIDYASIQADCDGYYFRWQALMNDPWLHALGYRLFQTVLIIQTFECCDGYKTNYVMGYIEAFSPMAGYDEQKSKDLEKTAISICRWDPCIGQRHDGVRRVTETRVLKMFIARPTGFCFQAFQQAPTAFVELSSILEQQGVGNPPAGTPLAVDCVKYWSQLAVQGTFARLPWRSISVPSMNDLLGLIVIPNSGIAGSERDTGISYVSDWDCAKCLGGRFMIQSKLDKAFRASRVF
ncbi:MAG: hypothetical protein H6840_09765 [Planctomycetes bacterium]|nr:hypothetical protein [Planctomycetota bacterium]